MIPLRTFSHLGHYMLRKSHQLHILVFWVLQFGCESGLFLDHGLQRKRSGRSLRLSSSITNWVIDLRAFTALLLWKQVSAELIWHCTSALDDHRQDLKSADVGMRRRKAVFRQRHMCSFMVFGRRCLWPGWVLSKALHSFRAHAGICC